jgi:cyclophilin family peptidyl-prolyl cis-trans isomerase
LEEIVAKKSNKSSRKVAVSRTAKSAHAVAREREEARRQQQMRQNRIIAIVGGVLAVLLVALIVWQFWPAARDESTAREQTAEVAEGTAIDSERPLAALEPVERLNYYDSFPATVIDQQKQYQAVIRTERGDIRLRLFVEEAPLAVNNFVFLATQGFYDGTIFHRVLEDFMAQAGDPTGTGMGGPGYRFEDEVDTGLTFDRPGLLAMANSGPHTNGSQFFITYEPTPWLNGLHTIFGELIEGEEVLNQITLRNPDLPTVPGDVIHRIDILESD